MNRFACKRKENPKFTYVSSLCLSSLCVNYYINNVYVPGLNLENWEELTRCCCHKILWKYNIVQKYSVPVKGPFTISGVGEVTKLFQLF